MGKNSSIFKQGLKEKQDEEEIKRIIAKAMVDKLKGKGSIASKEFARKVLEKAKEESDREERGK